MIQGFSHAGTQALYQDGECPGQWRSIEAVALRKLDMLDAAVKLSDLRSPPGNRLEALKSDRKGRYSIRSRP